MSSASDSGDHKPVTDPARATIPPRSRRFPPYKTHRSISGDWSQPVPANELRRRASIGARDGVGVTIDGRYTIRRRIGAGATSTVYEASDEQGTLWALKVLDLDSDREIERFQREHTLLQALVHPNIVDVVDSGLSGGRHFTVMPLLRGGTLLDWMRARTGQMDFGRACRLFAGAARGLHAAHEAGVVHRDVKPGNLAIEPDDEGTERLLVLDFGIAKSMAGTASLTDAGKVVGTPAYVCTERLFSGARATASWDVYSLGVVLYEVLTGMPLFRGRTWVQTMTRIQQHVPAPIYLMRKDCPAALDNLVAEMIAKTAHARPSGCDVVARRLTRIADKLES